MWEISLMITTACLYTFGMVYWVLSMGRIHRTPYLSHVILLLVISSSHSQVILYCIDCIYSSVSIHPQHVINLVIASVSSIFSISCSEYYTCFCACSVIFYFNCTLSYMLSTFQVLTHTCATSSRDVSSGSQHPDYA